MSRNKVCRKYINGVIEFLSNILLKFKFDIFVDMFSQNTFNSKLINETFISYCRSIMLIDLKPF